MSMPGIQRVATFAVIALLLIVLFVPLPSCSKEPLIEEEMIVSKEQHAAADVEETPAKKEIMVDIKGAVLRPGPYTFKLGDRIKDAVEKAGKTKQSDTGSMNLAARLIDGEEVVVPKKGEGTKPVHELEKSPAVPALVDLNGATSEELQTVPGIGPSKAEAIIAYREEKGGFSSFEELGEVKGFGEKTLESLKNYLVVY